MSYNGWTNYETWAVSLWIDNDQGSQLYWQEKASEYWAVAADPDEQQRGLTRSDVARYKLAECIKMVHEDGNPLLVDKGMDDTVYRDLLNSALCEVDWQEIANGLLEECEGYESVPERVSS